MCLTIRESILILSLQCFTKQLYYVFEESEQNDHEQSVLSLIEGTKQTV